MKFSCLTPTLIATMTIIALTGNILDAEGGMIKKINIGTNSYAEDALITITGEPVSPDDIGQNSSEFGWSASCYSCKTWRSASYLSFFTSRVPSYGKWKGITGSSVRSTARCSRAGTPISDAECGELLKGALSKIEITATVVASRTGGILDGAPVVGEIFDMAVVPEGVTNTTISLNGKSGNYVDSYYFTNYRIKTIGYPHDPGRRVTNRAGVYEVEFDTSVNAKYILGDNKNDVVHSQRTVGRMTVDVVEEINLTADTTELNCGTVIVGNDKYKKCPVVTFRNGSAPVDLNLWSLVINNVGGELKLYADDGGGSILPIANGTQPVRADGTMHLYISGRDMQRGGVVRGNVTVTASAK